jgi:hypothetical protein
MNTAQETAEGYRPPTNNNRIDILRHVNVILQTIATTHVVNYAGSHERRQRSHYAARAKKGV